MRFKDSIAKFAYYKLFYGFERAWSEPYCHINEFKLVKKEPENPPAEIEIEIGIIKTEKTNQIIKRCTKACIMIVLLILLVSLVIFIIFIIYLEIHYHQ